MKTVGIIAEYNPFHNGHLYQMTEARRLAKADRVIIVISPDFVQRGEPALLDKWVRARMALEAGADLVLELPVRYACGSAEFFAQGGVSLLSSLGVVDALSFGFEGLSENAAQDLHILTDAARFYLQEESGEYKKTLRNLLGAGISFAQARCEAYLKTENVHDPSGLLKQPNNILAVEYLKALLKTGSSMSAVPVPRKGALYHDLLPAASSPEPGTEQILFGSASGIRTAIAQGRPVSAYMPESACSLLTSELRENRYVSPSDMDLLLHDSLLRNREHLEEYLDVGDDLANRIRNLLGSYTGFEQFALLIKPKQMALTRIRRALMHVLLGIKDGTEPVSYARVLGFRSSAQPLLHTLSERSSVPLITKLPDEVPEGLCEDLRAAHMWEMIVSNRTKTPLRNEYQRKLVIL